MALPLACALGLGALHAGTMGFRVVSTEDGRRLAISEQALSLPPAQVRLPQPTSLQRALRDDGRVAIVTFIYSSCNAVCSVLGSQYQQMQASILERGLERQVRLLSISFDPRDTPTVLGAYAQRQHARPSLWQFASIDEPGQRAALLRAFGVVVLPAPMGEFQHNAAFHIVDPDGRLTRIDDIDQPDTALEHALALAAQRRKAL